MPIPRHTSRAALAREEGVKAVKFLFKWGLNGIIVTLLAAWYADTTYWTAFLVASGLAVIAFLVGDLFLLPKTNNTVATVSDFALAAAYLGIVRYFAGWHLSLGEIMIISALVAWAEWIYHRYILGQKLELPG
jgi:hypothetical protein